MMAEIKKPTGRHGEALLTLAKENPEFLGLLIANPVKALTIYGIQSNEQGVEILNKVTADLKKRALEALNGVDWIKHACNNCYNCCVII